MPVLTLRRAACGFLRQITSFSTQVSGRARHRVLCEHQLIHLKRTAFVVEIAVFTKPWFLIFLLGM